MKKERYRKSPVLFAQHPQLPRGRLQRRGGGDSAGDSRRGERPRRQSPSTYTKLDTTANGLYTVSEQTEKVLSGLDEDIDIYWIVQSGYEDSNIATLLDRCSLSDKISVTKKDPDVYPTFAKQYYDGQLYNNSLVVCRGDRYRYIDYNSIYEYDYSDYYSGGSVSQNFAGEGELTSAISYVVNDAMPTLYILTGHGEAELSSTFKTAIEKQNIQTESLSLLTVEAVPEDAGALLINTPAERYLRGRGAEKLRIISPPAAG